MVMVEDMQIDTDDQDGLPPKDIASAFYQKYDTKEVLGKGVSSTVRRAVFKETGVSVAVKIIDVSQELVDSDGLNLREQTMREINILRTVSGHENIIELLDVFETSTYMFLIFELAVNGELWDHLNSVVSISEKKARRIMSQILEAIRHCHSAGVVHRDVKPENILLDEHFNIKLTDFGFAKILQPGERLYDVCGTPGYLAPELLKAGMFERDECDGYGVEVDIWACGVVLYTMLAGFPPFWHRQRLKMIRQIMEGKYSFSSSEWNDVSCSPKDLISNMLVVDHKKRFIVSQCIRHPFFLQRPLSRKGSIVASTETSSETKTDLLPAPVKFNARRSWRAVLKAIQFIVRIRRLKDTPNVVCMKTLQENPYSQRIVRQILDNAAFYVYSHWIKRADGQNRAAMFEHLPKTCSLPITLDCAGDPEWYQKLREKISANRN